MSPVASTIASAGPRGRVPWRAPATGGSWSEGPGANAPAWAGKTTYPVQRFASPIAVSPSAEVGGFRAFSGFDGPDTWLPTRATYPTVDTPLGSAAVLALTYPGQIENITALDQTTTLYPFASNEYTNSAVKVTGTWSGTLAFEKSTDGGATWSPVTMTGQAGSSTGSSTTVNGLWTANTTATKADYDHIRVKATAWASGTAIVTVGMPGGQAPGNFTGARFTGNPTRIYVRVGFWTSADWSDNGNAGTKMFFVSPQVTGGQSTNHYVNLTDSSVGGRLYPLFGRQVGGWGANSNLAPSQSFDHGEWHDLEFIAHAGTAGGSDGIIQLWMNGIQVINQTGVPLFGSAMNPWFTSLYWNPTFGGGFNPPINQQIRLAQVYWESAA